MNPARWLYRSVGIGAAAATVYLLYKVPEWTGRLLRRPKPTQRDATHRRAASVMLRDHAINPRKFLIIPYEIAATHGANQ